ncbi:outer membrane lipoprotein-sorting protein [Sulfurovum sp. XGS-02]|uniref:outer membrane lipoprotein-sorting protein n=1 Tax=Sulfurovum sp. XGS-02 TaxID=2925411 RepID=UPI00205D1A50|nr:outer membrane lipoprotein-sorting protein [Sulfurovum sp. XGS-02]UPT78427.1 outer membrane lipoprotein-sorting protein [Sulfurovum sp. XGS-02]
MKWILSLLFLSNILLADEAQAIIKKLEKNLRGDYMYSTMNMIVTSKRGKRTVKIESWSEGNDKSFIKILYPKKDKGITFLKIDNQMWQYIPKIERTIKIPPSMMLQSWMGSDFTNDDMVKESSLEEDYHASILFQRGDSATLELIPRPNAAVVWGKIVIDVDLKDAVPIKEIFYDDMMQKVRVMTFSKIEQHGSHTIPMVMELQPLDPDKKKNRTKVIFEKVNFDTKIDPSYFTKQALKRYSR